MIPFSLGTDIAVFLAVTASVTLGFFVFYNNPKSITNRTFLLFSLAIVFWNIFNFLISQPLPSSLAIWILRLLIFFAVWLVFCLFQFFYVFPKDKIFFPNWFKYGLFPSVLFTAILTLTPTVFTRVIEYSSEGKIQKVANGAGIAIFGMVVVGLIIGSIYLLLKNLHSVKGIRRTQLQFILFGTTVTFCLYLVFNFILPAFFNNPVFIPYGAVFTLPVVGSTAYAIIKHHFLDIRLVVARTVSYTLLVGIFAIFYAVSFAIFSSVFIHSIMQYQTIAVSTLLALIMAFSFQGVRHFLEKITDRILYKDKYNTNKLLYNLALVMVSTLRLEDLTHQILEELLREVKITRGAFILTEDDHIYEIAHEGYAQAPEVDEQGILKVLKGNKTLIFEELPEGSEKELMRSMELTLVSPLITEGEYLGLLALGEKLSGDIYNSEDIRVVEILVPEASVAIQNAKAYEEIKRFNITLQEEVDQATKDLQVANAKLKNLDELKDEFVSVASHELRTPMTAIRSYAWMALHRSDVPLSKTLEKYITRVLMSTERLINLVNDMLNVSRIESNRVEINPEAVNLLALAKDIVDEVYFSKSQEQKIQFIVLEKPIPQVFADPDKLRQVFLNLVGNSLKFTPDGGKITFDFFTDGRVVETLISDTGVGISKEDISQLFHKFSRLDNSYTAAATSGGTGLGLYISKNLIELMHGKIWATSEGEGKGTTFIVSLPIATPDILKNVAKYRVKPQGETKVLEPVAL